MSGRTTVLRPASASVNGEEKCICELCECGNHHCPHDSSFKLGGGVEFSHSEYGKSFVGTKSEKPEGAFNATTTHRTDFTQKEHSVQQPVKPRSASYTRPDQPFVGISTHQADFDQKIVKPSTPLRPPSVLFPKTYAPFTEQSVHRQDYTVLPTSLQKSFKPKESRHFSDLPFQLSKSCTMSSKSPYIGSTLSLTTKTDLRYEGVLYNIDKENSTIALAKVRSFGTEDRLAAVRVGGQDQIFEFIVFKTTDVKELVVCKAPEKSPLLKDGLPEDPAIVSYSKQESVEKKTSPKSQLLAALQSRMSTIAYSRLGTPLSSIKCRPSRLQALGIGMRINQPISQSDPGLRFARKESAFTGRNPVYSAGFSSNGRPFSGHAFVPSVRFKTDYDFEAANKEFSRYHDSSSENATAIATKEKLKSMVKSVLGKTQEEKEVNKQEGCKADDSKESFYDRKTSFFDCISGTEAERKRNDGSNGFSRYSLDSAPLPNYFGLPEYELSYRQQMQRYRRGSPISTGQVPGF